MDDQTIVKFARIRHVSRSARQVAPPPLTVDAMCADLADLLGIARGSVTPDSDLIGLGLDSIRAMRLVGRWRRAGHDLRFADIASGSTLAEWWMVVDQGPESTRPVPAETGTPRAGEPFSLTPVQHAYWVGRAQDQVLGGVGCHAYLEFDAPGTIAADRLEAAGRALVRRHEMLRAAILDDGTQQIFEDDPWPGLTVHDVEDEAAAERLRDRLSHRQLDVSRRELFDIHLSRLPDGRSRVHVEVDFLACDVVGLHILLDDLAALYLDPEDPPPPLSYSFSDYQREHSAAQGEARDRDRSWWQERLKDLSGPPALPRTKDPAQIEHPWFVRRQAWLPWTVWDALTDRARSHGVTPAMVLATAYAEVLGRWSTHQRFTLNLPVFTRDDALHPDVSRLVADFTDLLLLPIDLTESAGFTARAHAIQQRFRDVAEHTAYSGVDVLRDLTRSGEAAGGAAVFACNLGNDLLSDTARKALGTPGFMVTQTPQVWLDHQINEYPEGLHLAIDAVDELFPDGTLDAILDAYVGLLTTLVDADWEDPVTLDLPQEHQTARTQANATGAPCAPRTLHESFFDQAGREANRVAVADGELIWNYGELADRALRVAGALRARGITPGDAVAITLPRGAERIAAVLGVLACGGTYVPVGSDQPPHRRALVLKRAQAKATLAENRSTLTDGESLVTISAALSAEPLDTPTDTDPRDPAYVIFTSGSTGEPKGVEVSHGAAWNTVDDILQRCDVGPEDTVLALSALEFDLSVFDIFGMLARGSSLVVVPEEAARDARIWADLCERHGVTIWNSVPMLLEMLLAARSDRPLPSTLRIALVSGDWAAVELPSRVADASADRCRLQILGGATEAAIWSNVFPGDRVERHWPSIPYGFPLRGQRFRVVDEIGRDVPDWVTGELWIGGAGVADGYRGESTLTADRFVTDAGQRWYRTGDLGRYRPDGCLEFLGRADTQVKVRGHRIELGEIETALESSPQVHRAVVVAPGERAHRRLVGFITPSSADPASLAEHLGERLAPHAIPSEIVPLDSMPLTGNGKIDRGALSHRAASQRQDPPDSRPEGQVETEVAGVWCDLLGVSAIHRHDDFLRLGGDSLLATKLVAELRRRQYDGATLSALFDNPTLTAFCSRLTRSGREPQDETLVHPDPARRHDPFPPTEVQRAYLVGRSDRFALGGVGCHFYTEVDGADIDLDRLTAAWNILIERHAMLRTVFDADGLQRVLPEVPRFRIAHVEDTHQLRTEMADQVLDPTRWPLFDVRACPTVAGTRVGISFDNVLLDALSLMLLRSELDVLYRDPQAHLPRVDLTFRDYVHWMRPTEESLDQARAYWGARLPSLPPAPNLPLITDPSDIGKPHFVRRQHVMDQEQWRRLQEVAGQHRLTPSTILASAYAEVLSAWSGQPDLTLTMTLFDRRDVHPHVNRVLGDFTSLLLAEYRYGADRLATARALQASVAEGLDHSEVPAVWVLRELARRATGTAVTMPVVFTSMLGVGPPQHRAEPIGTETWGISQTPQVWIDCQVGDVDGDLLLRWDAVEDLFDATELDEMFAAFTSAVTALAKGDWSHLLAVTRREPSGPAARTPLLDAREIDRTETASGLPRPGAEHEVAQMWSELLGRSVVDRSANFFILGGDSLTATRLVDLAERRLGARLSLRAFFEDPTVAGCASALIEESSDDVEVGEL